MIAFAELLERLVFTPSRNAKIALLRRYFATQPDPDRGVGLAAITGELSFTAAKPGLIRELAAARTDPVLFAWSYDYVGDLAETVALMWPAAPTNAAPPRLAEVVEALESAPKIRAAGHCRGLAGCVRCIGAAGAAQADHRRSARRRLGAAGEDRAGRDRRRRGRRCGGGVARPGAALSAAVRLAGEARAAARSGAGAGVPSADAGASAGGGRHRRTAAGGLARRVEMGRHPRAARRDRRRQTALFAWRRGHLRRVPGNHRGDGFPCRAGWRTAGGARWAGGAVRRSAAAAEPQGGQRAHDGGLPRRHPALRHAVRGGRGRAPAAVRCAAGAAGGLVCADASGADGSVGADPVLLARRTDGAARRRARRIDRRADAEARRCAPMCRVG